jgi:branched-chain amino acid transport system permease protein
VFLAAALRTGLAGALIFVQTARISPDAAFSVTDWTAYVIFIVVIGGIGRIEGPSGRPGVLGLPNGLGRLRGLVPPDAGAARHVVMLVAPRGLWGLISDRTGLQLFPVRRRLAGLTARED